jgi:hypothetical protein
VSESAGQPAHTPRTWRPMAAWTAGILLALGLAWFVGAVVWPVWQVRFVVNQIAAAAQGQHAKSHMPLAAYDLGEPRQACAKIRLYMRTWRPSGVQETGALSLYAAYASRSCEAAVEGLTDPSPLIRVESARVLGEMLDTRSDIISALERAVHDDDKRVSFAAESALKKIWDHQNMR